MQIIIDIDEDDYKLIKDGGNIPSNLRDLITASLFYRIRNGKLLPKGHGDLIDKSDLLVTSDIRADGSEFAYVSYSEINNATTVIEADKEVQNADNN